MLNKLLKRYQAYKKNRQEQKEIHQKLEDMTHPFLIERILKHNGGKDGSSRIRSNGSV